MQRVDLSPLRDWIQRSDRKLGTTLNFSVGFNGNDYPLWLVRQPDDVVEVTVFFPHVMSISEHAAEALLNDIDQELGGEVSFIFHTNSLRISAIAHMRPEELELKMEGFIVLCDCLTLIFNRVVDTGQWGARLITLALLLREGGTLVH